MWFYPVSKGTILRNVTEEGLIKMIFEWRLRNNVPIGDIEADIDKMYCERWPQACHAEPSDSNPLGQPLPPSEPLMNRIARWVGILAQAMPRGGYKLVEKDTAEARAAICHGCPKNVSWRGGCSGCTASTSAILISIRQMKKTTRDGNLLGCLVCGTDTQTAVWLDPQTTPLTEDQALRLPARCWLKKP